jgi:hypothetical protein
MIGKTVTFKNHPTANGLETFSIDDCLIANNGTPNTIRPQILIHLPNTTNKEVDGSFVSYDGYDWHVIGTTAAQMDSNTPTRWNRYAIAERIKAL